MTAKIHLFAYLGVMLSPGPAALAAGDRYLNIVFILADDLGWTDLGCYGSKYYQTPNIDRLASEGVRFTSAYSAGPNCQPTRAALLTGLYGPRTGVYTVGSEDRFGPHRYKMRPPKNVRSLPLDKRTIAEAIRESHYSTGMFGKWHLGDEPDRVPFERGFDRAIASQGRHFGFTTRPKTKTKPGEYLADFLTDRALEFVEANHQHPFFLYVPHFAVHAPLEAKRELIEKYRSLPPSGGHKNPVYAAMIESLDQSVGRILDKLDELKIADRTVVMFSSDNGGVGGYRAAGIRNQEYTDNAPLRGGKGMLYEGGIRVPFIIRWPRVSSPGTVSDEPIHSVDFFPTCLGIADLVPEPGLLLDGEDLRPVVATPTFRMGGRDLFWHFPTYLGAQQGDWRTTPCGAIRAGDYKLLEFFEDGRVELYNLKEDIGEKRDLAASMPEKANELRSRLARWRETQKAPMPIPLAAKESR